MERRGGAAEVGGAGEPLPAADPLEVADLTEDAVRLEDEGVRRELLELSITAAGIGTFDWDLVSGTLTWDDRLVELFGHDAAASDRSIDTFTARLHPDDARRVDHDLQTAIAAGGEFAAEYRIVLPGDRVRWIGARGRALCDQHGTSVRMLGAAWDVSGHREGEAQVAGVLESMSTAFFSLDHSWRFTYVNAEAERVLGGSRSQLLGGVLWDLFPAAVGSDVEASYRRVMDTGETVTFDAHHPALRDAWFEVRAWRNADGVAVSFVDVTDRRRLQERADQAARRAHLLGRITDELVGTLDSDEASARLTRLVVPVLADWCIVSLVDDDRQAGTRRGLRAAAARHTDPQMQPVVDAYARQRLDVMRDDAIVVRAMETGQPQFLSSGATTDAQAMIQPGPVRELLGDLAPEHVVIHPLTGRNGPVGLLTLCNGAARGPFSDEDLVTAGHVAARAGLVLDNARLYRQQRDLAEGLQRSLLTPPPEPDRVQVVVRYTPAAEAAQVGGDWYDAFVQPGGATVLVIGDVVGHDVQAAAAMGQVRTVLRTIGAVDHDSPAAVLRTVDRAMQTLRIGTTATAVVARLEQTEDERDRGLTRLRWSNAGHPPPMVVDPDGSIRVLSGTASDLLLGVDPDTARGESEVGLDRDAVVLLYTDGLVERRGQSLDAGLERLGEALQDLAGRDLDELCDELLVRLLPERPEDDVALVAVRLHPQDRLRPPEAGPNRIPPDVPDAPAVVPQQG